MRVFFAVPLPLEWKDELQSVQDELLKKADQGRATPVDNIHLTLQFVGDLDDPSELIEACKELRLPKPSFRSKGLNAFRRGREELVFLELLYSPELIRINQELRKTLDGLAIDYDRKKFKAHITLLRRVLWKDKVELSRLKVDLPVYEPEAFYLFSSTLTSQGASYKVLERFSFRE